MKKVLYVGLLMFVSISHASAQSFTAQTHDLTVNAPITNNVPSVLYPADQYPSAQGQYLALPATPNLSLSQPAAKLATMQRATVVAPPPAVAAPTIPAVTAARPHQPVPVLTQYQILSSSLQPGAALPIVQPAEVEAQPVTVSDLPNYTYNSSIDTTKRPYKTPIAHDGSSNVRGQPVVMDLSTRKGFTVGAQISSYRYQEHTDDPSTDFARENGPKFGLTASYTGIFGNGWFMTGDLRGAYGQNDYAGSGNASGISDWIFEARLLGGKDFIFYNSLWGGVDISLSPYVGFGYRFLYNAFGGKTTDTGAAGYDRYSNYLYIPIGVTPRIRITDKSRLSINLEYDQFVYGWELTELTDIDPTVGDVRNTQTGGYGLRAEVMYEWLTWSVGPFVNFWNINSSKGSCDNAVCGVEPNNQTLEGGIQVRYKF